MSTTVEQLLARKGHEYFFVRPDASMAEAVAMYGKLNVGALLVCDGDRLVGMLSERDCVRRVMALHADPETTEVRDVMTPGPICVAPTETIDHCMAVMSDSRIRHLPVVLYGRIVGVISMGDVVHATLMEKEQLIDELEGYISGHPSVRPMAS